MNFGDNCGWQKLNELIKVLVRVGVNDDNIIQNRKLFLISKHFQSLNIYIFIVRHNIKFSFINGLPIALYKRIFDIIIITIL